MRNGPGMSRSAAAASTCSLRRQYTIIEITTMAPTTASAIANGAPIPRYLCRNNMLQARRTMPGHRTRAVGNHEFGERHPVCSRNEPDDRSQHSHEAGNDDNQHSLTPKQILSDFNSCLVARCRSRSEAAMDIHTIADPEADDAANIAPNRSLHAGAP